jgi:AcrR family transcriptional regulator
MARTGRRPGDSGATRDAILAAAAASFSERGYEGTTIRGVAGAAGVDPALVHHYFGTKAQLFGTVMALPITPDRVVTDALAGPRDHLGETIVRTVLNAWEPIDRSPVIALVRSAATNEDAATLLRGFVEQEIVARLAAAADGPETVLRASLMASHMVGIAMARYIVRIEPLASATIDDIAATAGPVLQRYLMP